MQRDFVNALYELENIENANKVYAYMQALPEQNGYALGDHFVGISVPDRRDFVKKYYQNFTQQDIVELISSSIHDYRSIGIIYLVEKFKKSKTHKEKEDIFKQYLFFRNYINHWDLVDMSAPTIIGQYLCNYLQDISYLESLLKEENIWSQRMSIVATFAYIKNNNFEPTFIIAQQLFFQKHPMVQKAVGWMIKEVGKQNMDASIAFVQKHLEDMYPLTVNTAKEHYPQAIKQSLKSTKK